MIEDAPIVRDTRRIRSLISNRFANDIDKYVAYLSAAKARRRAVPKPRVRESGPDSGP